MQGAKLTGAPNGTKLMEPKPAPMRGEEVPSMNKAMPSGFKGGKSDLSRSLGGASVGDEGKG